MVVNTVNKASVQTVNALHSPNNEPDTPIVSVQTSDVTISTEEAQVQLTPKCQTNIAPDKEDKDDDTDHEIVFVNKFKESTVSIKETVPPVSNTETSTATMATPEKMEELFKKYELSVTATLQKSIDDFKEEFKK